MSEYPEKSVEDISPYEVANFAPKKLSPKTRIESLMPSLDLDNLHANIEVYLNDFHSMIDEVFKSHGSSLLRSVGESKFSPPTRVKNNGKEYTIEIGVPWVEKKDLQVSITDDKLVVEGEVRDSEKSELTQSVEFGKFHREFPLEGVDTELASSSLENGVLKVTMPIKKERDGPKMKSLEIK